MTHTIHYSDAICFFGDYGSVVATKEKYSDTDQPYYFIFRLYVPKKERRKGEATALMNAVINKLGKYPLHLTPEPYADTRMTTEQLIEFYKKFGFQLRNEHQIEMIRKGE